MARLQAVLFDIDDTLCPTTEFARRARRNAVRAMVRAGLDADEDAVAAELDEVIAEFSSNYEHHFDKLLLRLPRGTLRHENRALVVAAGVAAYHDTKFRELRPFAGAMELLQQIRDRTDVRLGVITHGLSVKQAEKLVRLGLVPFMDPELIFISDQIGISKPNPKIYAAALARMDLPAASVMYVGDNPENDVAPAHEVGIVTVWARRASKQGTSRVEPDYEIWSFEELGEILRRDFALPLDERRVPAT